MIINDVHRGIVKRKSRKRICRGVGSGIGRTGGKGEKGHSSRSGFSYRLSFEGGQMPLMRKVAKRGFNNRYFAPKVAIVNLYQIEENFENGAVVNVETLVAAGLVKGKFDSVKILGTGDIKKSVTVKVPSISQSAVEKIEKAGGKVEIEL